VTDARADARARRGARTRTSARDAWTTEGQTCIAEDGRVVANGWRDRRFGIVATAHELQRC
jgi:hypothetical protein